MGYRNKCWYCQAISDSLKPIAYSHSLPSCSSWIKMPLRCWPQLRGWVGDCQDAALAGLG
ncbi:phage major head subunit gpT-like protein [Herpetosiphon giganteus]|nr:phage major head subunit gpT-like protein [Herpetosiphon giganteus]